MSSPLPRSITGAAIAAFTVVLATAEKSTGASDGAEIDAGRRRRGRLGRQIYFFSS